MAGSETGALECDHVRGHAPSSGIKIPSGELAAAMEEAFEAVCEEVFGGEGFTTEY